MVNRPGRNSRDNGKGGFKYRRPDPEDIKRRSEAKGNRQYDSIFINNVDVWRAKEGANDIRMCPPTWPDYEHYGYEVQVHQYIGADGGNYLCLKKNIDPKTGRKMNKPCAACDAAARAKSDGDDDEAKRIEARTRFVCYIVDRAAKEPREQLYDMSWTMDRDLATLSHNKRTGKTLYIADPDEGFDIEINRKGTDKTTKYVMQISREPSALLDEQDEQDDLIQRIEELPAPDCLNFVDNEYLRSVLEGTNDRGEDDNDSGGADNGDGGNDRRDDRRGRGRDRDERDDGRRRPARGARRDDPPDEGDEQGQEEGDGDQGDSREEAPRGRSRGRGREPEPEAEEGNGDEQGADDGGDQGEADEPRTRGRDRGGRDREEAPRGRSRGRDSGGDNSRESAPRSRRSSTREAEPVEAPRGAGRERRRLGDGGGNNRNNDDRGGREDSRESRPRRRG